MKRITGCDPVTKSLDDMEGDSITTDMDDMGEDDSITTDKSDFTIEDLENEFRKEIKMNKYILILSVVLILVGGPVISVVVSYMHNFTDFPPDLYRGYGYLDQMVGTMGVIIFIVGIILLFLYIYRKGKLEEKLDREWRAREVEKIRREAEATDVQY